MSDLSLKIAEIATRVLTSAWFWVAVPVVAVVIVLVVIYRRLKLDALEG